jgi:hypothetical protein
MKITTPMLLYEVTETDERINFFLDSLMLLYEVTDTKNHHPNAPL